LKKVKLLIVLSGFKAKIFSINKSKLDFLKEYIHTEELTIKDARRKTTSGFVAPTSMPSHKFDPHETLKTTERKHFCQKMSQELAKLVTQLNASEILISADSKTLGELRKHLDVSIMNKITAELPKDLINLPTKKLEEYLPRMKE